MVHFRKKSLLLICNDTKNRMLLSRFDGHLWAFHCMFFNMVHSISAETIERLYCSLLHYLPLLLPLTVFSQDKPDSYESVLTLPYIH